MASRKDPTPHAGAVTPASPSVLRRRVPGPSPESAAFRAVEAILRKAASNDEGALRLAEVKRRMRARSVRHSTVRECVDELKRLHAVTEDSEVGVLWTLLENPAFWNRKGLQRL